MPRDGTQILLLDDDEKLGRLVREYLETFGYSGTAPHNGLAALDVSP